MLNYLTLAAKVQLNVHDLNNEAVAGNVTDIRMISFLDSDNQIIEAPAVSGRMLKHWHYESMRKIIDSFYKDIPLCQSCEIGEPLRPGRLNEKDSKKIEQNDKSEIEIISSCAICDVHGFLIAQTSNSDSQADQNTSASNKSGKKSKKSSGTSSRRNSRVLFSWLLPVIGAETTRNQVIHSRVTSQTSQEEGEKSSQMIYSKSYASGVYGFVSALDVKRIGFSETSLLKNRDEAYIDENSRKSRAEVAIEAYRLMLTGQMGASLSHALPHAKPLEILVCYSHIKPVPFPVSPIYQGYLKETAGILPDHAKLIYWSSRGSIDEDFPKEKIEVVDTVDEIFVRLLKELS